MSELKEAKLIRGYTQFEIFTNPEINGAYLNPWALTAKKDSQKSLAGKPIPINYEIRLLVRGKHNQTPQPIDWQKNYALLDVSKIDWSKSYRKKSPDQPLTTREIKAWQQLLNSLKAEQFPIFNELNQPANPTQLSEVLNFLLPRLPHIRQAYISNTTYAQSELIESNITNDPESNLRLN